ncbi:hybrid sensor histidine kinase/response regulator [Beggiatoa leptomitoformis]|uniref:histidine kinase n=1 Tax=Beggiatoa leptomitoformis TaxID=288004 RepID=A0A2N9YJ26_9GAMM|nr:hybrid sensor histidine kinase/response regulator [Beggiatoa leptomitoformis]ALG67356.1 response regulator [Beggiatoa leptomitoformis]AUI70439.1 response regulator [Beggiatoa leptomitoformis]
MIQSSKILIVDDESVIREQLESTLNGEKYEIQQLVTGKALLDWLSAHTADLILLDVMLPDIDGFSVCQRIREQAELQHIPIILISSLERKEILAQGLEAGADDFLSKPINRMELRARVRSMLRIKHQYDELATMLKLRQELSNMVIHDMSSSITSILLHATLIGETATDETTQTHVERILMAADRLDSFVNDMLMMAKMEENKLLIHPTSTNVNELALETQQHFSIIAESRNVQLSLALPDKPIKFFLDSHLFRRVMDNLMANAIQYSPAHSTVTLRITTFMDENTCDHLRMEIIDEGTGIPEEYRERVFEKFEVVDLKKKGISQIGLGLAFCKMVITAHQGKIFVTPNQPQGSIFTVEI